MFLSSNRLKNQKKTGRVKYFDNKIKNLSEESIIKISIVLICVIAYLFIAYFYPNLFAWQNKAPASTGQLELQLPGRINKDYYRILLVNLSKGTTGENRTISDVRILTVDKKNSEINSYLLPLDLKVNFEGSEISIYDLYSKDYERFVSILENSLLFRTEYAIIFNEEHLNTALKKYSIADKNEDLIDGLLSKIQSDNLGFFKQGFWGSWFSLTVSNLTASDFKGFLVDLKNSKPIKFEYFSKDKLKNHILADPSIIKDQLRVEISNSSDLQGLATDYAKTFENMGMTISKVSNFDFISYQNLVFIPKEYENTITFFTIKSLVGDAKFLYENPTKFSTADILVVVAK